MTTRSNRCTEVNDFAFVLIGGTGDLAMRKTLPALYAAHHDGTLEERGRIVAVAQTSLDQEGYQRLLLDVIAGRLALFVRRDEQEAAWKWVAPILEEWSRSDAVPKPCAAGTWGPAAASALLAREGTCWLEEES